MKTGFSLHQIIQIKDDGYPLPSNVCVLFYKYASFVTTYIDDDDDNDDDDADNVVVETINTATNTTAATSSTTETTSQQCKQLLHHKQLNRINAQLPFRTKSIITLAQFKCLQPEKWLNDAVLNGYIELLQKRDNRLVSQNPNRQPTLFINSWLMAKSHNQPGQNYQLIKRFTKKHDIFTKKAIPIVIHIPGHWLLASVFIQAKCIQYYNSINNNDMMAIPILDQLFKWITLESIEGLKRQQSAALPIELNREEWTLEQIRVPQQQNGYDCGVFTLALAEYIMDNEDKMHNDQFEYSQQNMPQYRERIALSLYKGKLEPHHDA